MNVFFITPPTVTVLSSLPSVWGMNVDTCQGEMEARSAGKRQGQIQPHTHLCLLTLCNYLLVP